MKTFVEAVDPPEGAPLPVRPAVTYLNCPRCGLSIELRSHWLAVAHCPRCIARAHLAVELFSSGLPVEVLYAEGSAPATGGESPVASTPSSVAEGR